MDIDGQVAVVTGGGSGLGRAAAEALAARGAKVAVVDRNAAAAEEVANAIAGLALAFDVADAIATETGLARVGAALGTPRILVNCAGIGVAKRVLGKEGPQPLADFEQVVRVNLIGSFNTLRLAAAEMAKLEPLAGGERGVVINTASVAAFEGQVGQAAYSASKGGIVAMTLPIARELAQFGIRVNVIAPGLFSTPLLRSLPEEVQASLAKSIPFPSRLGEPAEFAKLALHMVENSFLNGEVVRLDGALRLPPR
ncbi:SDR family NAD(P)-dependent oxidoreductase [Blastochloris viridis]|uniref:3-oxoacyl-[acyl-carrier-protein] reductase FabG n=1 Tax=Blastochloris viridis TaxID=1079 RepID=A0A0H5BEL5_BLAVI|nr:SDR family NAD(P)-dependent oxidoreductase [Blastochloris viridis]ALK09458.1 3-oxoacyl-[acyl-carrier-protein] reductase FabG [Blastochloris viridis]BAS00661.1 putative 3-hydroxyacyl-CoA dehydrogenase [Blastochloris viridis]CUU42121.1 3-oxoacyl-[acyl-carrier-protein] reductase FabG [Blastochloris viridis]